MAAKTQKKVEKVRVSYTILVKGMIGGSFDMPKAEYQKIRDSWESRPRRHDETELAHEVIDWSQMGFDHLNIDDMEIEEFELVESKEA